MTDCIAHRGPDDHGQYVSPERTLGLGHRRLAIIDLAPTGHQPMVSRDGSCRIVFNGEIYNYRELRQDLLSSGNCFRGSSDTEVLLELFARDGIDGLARVNGIFAFAVWNERSRCLTLARDGLGVKPIYYADVPDGFVFASELKALLHAPNIPREYDQEVLSHYLTYLWAPSPGTPLKSVRKLEPGEWLNIRDGHIKQRGYFYQLPSPAVEARTVQDTISQLDAKLRSAVRRQLVSDVPVAAFLSGGVDSSAVVAMAQQASVKPLDCFTIRLTGSDSDADGMVADLPYARSVAQHLGVRLNEIEVDASRMADDLDWMVRQLDEPQADPACLNTHYICSGARQHGYKVMLSGTGGDDIFSGYRRHLALHSERLWSWLPKRMRGLVRNGTARLSVLGNSGRRLAKGFQYADCDPADRLVSYFFWTPPETTYELLPGLDANIGAPMKFALDKRADIRLPMDQMLFLETRFFLADHNLLYTDKMSMANGVEVRVPLIDYELVEFAATIPSGLKQRGHASKWILKRAVERYLPREIVTRPKTGFGVPLRQWLAGPLRGRMIELLQADGIGRIPFFDPKAIAALQNRTLRGEVDGWYTLFALMCMALWHRHFVS
jgi:asparagine synthase (glutamine-hydrolysing)